MPKPHEPGVLNRLAKHAAPYLAQVLRPAPLQASARLAGTYLSILQGFGAGSGWDLRGEIDVAVELVRRSRPVIFDVGANRGDYAAELQRALAHLDPQFLLFEPSPACQEILERRSIPGARLIRAAVGESPGTADLTFSAPGSPTASLHERRDSYFQSTPATSRVQVDVVTIDGVMAESGVTLVDFMKIDTEGHDLAVLLGASEALREGRVRVLTFEFGSGQINSRTFFHDFWDLLQPLGFALRRICPGGRTVPVDEYYEDLEYFRGVTNYLALAPASD
jgi:FkbM family methyltransferase